MCYSQEIIIIIVALNVICEQTLLHTVTTAIHMCLSPQMETHIILQSPRTETWSKVNTVLPRLVSCTQVKLSGFCLAVSEAWAEIKAVPVNCCLSCQRCSFFLYFSTLQSHCSSIKFLPKLLLVAMSVCLSVSEITHKFTHIYRLSFTHCAA